MDLNQTAILCRLMADTTRVRLLHLLDQEELSVAELAAITQLAQPRVSTHLAKLKETQLVVDRREGVSVFYRLNPQIKDRALETLWQVIQTQVSDPLLVQDRQRIAIVLRARSSNASWADSVAGDMERHYSPGRTWEATARALTSLLNLGRVLDIASGDGVLAELLAPQAKSITCLDLSDRVIQAAQQRLRHTANVKFQIGDMQQMPFEDGQFDTVLLMHALTYSAQPKQLFSEISRVLKPGGELLAVTLKAHKHTKTVEPYGHNNLGFSVHQLKQLCKQAKLDINTCKVSSVERKAPNFSVITLHAGKPGQSLHT